MSAQRRFSRLVHSRFFGWVTNLPLIAPIIRRTTRGLVERQLDPTAAETRPQPPSKLVETGLLEDTLQRIVFDVVDALDYAGAMVATYEQGDTLPVRAIYVDPRIVNADQIRRWETEISAIAGREISISNPKVARVFRYDHTHQDNLSVRAAMARQPVVSDQLYSLFTPIAPPAAVQLVEGIQQALGIRQVIAVPFFLETTYNKTPELVGNLFAAKRSPINERDIRILAAFARQAAAAIESERRRLQIEVAHEIVHSMQSHLIDEEQILQRIVRGVVSDLGYLATVVVTSEHEGAAPLESSFFDPYLTDITQMRRWQTAVSEMALRTLQRTKTRNQNGAALDPPLGVKAGEPIIIQPHADAAALAPLTFEPALGHIQQALGIQRVIAVPLFFEIATDHQKPELVGFLLAATRSKEFSHGEVALLKVFGQQAAVGIRNARLYRKAKERRETAETFAKMAFTAAKSIHALRNHIGYVQTSLQLLRMVEQLPDEHRREAFNKIIESTSNMSRRLEQATEILSNLHEPWRLTPNVPTDVNVCITRAARRLSTHNEIDQNVMHHTLAENLPQVYASPEMLTEALQVLIKNSLEATQQIEREPLIEIASRVEHGNVVVSIIDNGVGIRTEHLGRIFDMKWTTKESAMGFGLFWARDYIEGLGGRIEVHSVWQQGATFHVCLPIDRPAAAS